MKPSLGSARGRPWRRRARAVSGSRVSSTVLAISREGLGAEAVSGVGAEIVVRCRCESHRRYATIMVAERDFPIALQGENSLASSLSALSVIG